VAAAPAARRRALVTSRVREQALRTLGLGADFALDPRQGLRDVGLDSLMAVELRNALQQVAGRPLPSTLLFDFPTVEGLSGYLLDAITQADAKPVAPAPVASAPLPAIADEDAEDLLREELAKMRSERR
jgi:acyl carrier protein